VTDAAASRKYYRVNSAERSRVGRELVQMFNDKLLTRVRDIEPKEAGAFSLLQHLTKRRRPTGTLVEIEHNIAQGQAERFGLLHVQGRTA
jgi:hypothetical protein